MISTSFEMIMNGSCAAAILGICLGVVYSFFSLVFGLICHKKHKADSLMHNESNVGLGRNIFDFLFALSSGILYLILVYVFMDGSNAFSPLCLLFLAFMVTKRIINSFIANILGRKE